MPWLYWAALGASFLVGGAVGSACTLAYIIHQNREDDIVTLTTGRRMDFVERERHDRTRHSSG
jgi:hypothetical protein